MECVWERVESKVGHWYDSFVVGFSDYIMRSCANAKRLLCHLTCVFGWCVTKNNWEIYGARGKGLIDCDW